MTMYYRLFFSVILVIIWCSHVIDCLWSMSSNQNVLNLLYDGRGQRHESSDFLSKLNNQIEPINESFNSIDHRSSHNYARLRRFANESANEFIKINLSERYPSDENSNKTLDEAIKFLNENNAEALKMSRQTNIASWNYETNLTEHNKQIFLYRSFEQAKFDLQGWTLAKSWNWKKFNDTRIQRRFRKLTTFNSLAIGDDKFKEINLIGTDLLDIYSKARICKYKSKDDCNLQLEPDITELFKKSRDYDELKWLWEEWRNATGKKMRSKYLRLIQLMNEQANKNGFNDAGESWRENYKTEKDDFEQQLDEQLRRIEPLYKLLHAYVRKQLRELYGPDRILADGPIPANLLGNMWAQDWSNANLEILLPFPKRVKTDLSQNLIEKNLTEIDLFRTGESFFKSLGLPDLPQEFWNYSVLVKPEGRELVCHASAWDLIGQDVKDVRIKQCAKVNHEHFVVAHHELGHIYYYLLYSKQPFVFRDGANAGFHEAVGDLISLSVQTPKHLKTIGLVVEYSDDNGNNKTAAQEQDDLNFLMRMALTKIAFLPFGYSIDKYRWDLFRGKITEDKLNSEWWRLRGELQGICPPSLRTENDFDPGAKYHVPATVPYIRYVVSHLLQFQFDKYLCDASGYKGSLNQCDIHESKEAGKRLRSALELGSSVDWPEVLKVFSNGTEDKLNADALIEYFDPLIVWLKKQLTDEDQIGWKITNPNICPNH